MTRLLFAGALAVAALVAGGCLGPGTTRSTEFYVLSSVEPAAPEAEGSRPEGGAAVGVGPIALPAYLDRSEIIARTSANRIELYEFARWGEPLQTNFARVLANDVARLLPTDRVAVFPWDSSTPVAYRVEVEVARFGQEPGGAVMLVARWQLFREDERGRLLARRCLYREEAERRDPASAVAAMSRALARLARDVSEAIRDLDS